MSDKNYWEKKEIFDFCSDFLDLDLNNPTDSVSKITADFTDKFIEKGYSITEAQQMSLGVDIFLEELLDKINWVE